MPESKRDEVHTHVQRALHSLLLEDRQGAAGYLRRALTCLNADIECTGNKIKAMGRENSFRSWRADWS